MESHDLRSDSYYRLYPTGLKRKRDAEQREKQRVSQRRYDRSRKEIRKYLVMAKKVANGATSKHQHVLGCTPEEFVEHMRSTIAGGFTEGQLVPRLHKPVDTAHRGDPTYLKKAFHYTNLYAVLKERHLPGGYRRRKIPRTLEEARRMACG